MVWKKAGTGAQRENAWKWAGVRLSAGKNMDGPLDSRLLP
nr:MAG TPA: hypothetical protein [Caudoviricetes sp.]